MSVSEGRLALVADTVRARTLQVVAKVYRWVAFWMAVALPLVYLPLLATGLDGGRTPVVFVLLVSAHICALWAGRAHGRGGRV